MLGGVLVDDIKKQITEAMKSGDALARDILRLALSEIQSAEARPQASASEDAAAAVVRKLIKSNEETLVHTTDTERASVLRKESAILSALLPKQLSVDDIVAALAGQRDAIKAAGNDGQATGIAMKHLKATGAAVSGNDVGAAVKKIRA